MRKIFIKLIAFIITQAFFINQAAAGSDSTCLFSNRTADASNLSPHITISKPDFPNNFSLIQDQHKGEGYGFFKNLSSMDVISIEKAMKKGEYNKVAIKTEFGQRNSNLYVITEHPKGAPDIFTLRTGTGWVFSLDAYLLFLDTFKGLERDKILTFMNRYDWERRNGESHEVAMSEAAVSIYRSIRNLYEADLIKLIEEFQNHSHLDIAKEDVAIQNIKQKLRENPAAKLSGGQIEKLITLLNYEKDEVIKNLGIYLISIALPANPLLFEEMKKSWIKVKAEYRYSRIPFIYGIGKDDISEKLKNAEHILRDFKISQADKSYADKEEKTLIGLLDEICKEPYQKLTDAQQEILLKAIAMPEIDHDLLEIAALFISWQYYEYDNKKGVQKMSGIPYERREDILARYTETTNLLLSIKLALERKPTKLKIEKQDMNLFVEIFLADFNIGDDTKNEVLADLMRYAIEKNKQLTLTDEQRTSLFRHLVKGRDDYENNVLSLLLADIKKENTFIPDEKSIDFLIKKARRGNDVCRYLLAYMLRNDSIRDELKGKINNAIKEETSKFYKATYEGIFTTYEMLELGFKEKNINGYFKKYVNGFMGGYPTVLDTAVVLLKNKKGISREKLRKLLDKEAKNLHDDFERVYHYPPVLQLAKKMVMQGFNTEQIRRLLLKQIETESIREEDRFRAAQAAITMLEDGMSLEETGRLIPLVNDYDDIMLIQGSGLVDKYVKTGIDKKLALDLIYKNLLFTRISGLETLLQDIDDSLERNDAEMLIGLGISREEAQEFVYLKMPRELTYNFKNIINSIQEIIDKKIIQELIQKGVFADKKSAARLIMDITLSLNLNDGWHVRPYTTDISMVFRIFSNLVLEGIPFEQAKTYLLKTLPQRFDDAEAMRKTIKILDNHLQQKTIEKINKVANDREKVRDFILFDLIMRYGHQADEVIKLMILPVVENEILNKFSQYGIPESRLKELFLFELPLKKGKEAFLLTRDALANVSTYKDELYNIPGVDKEKALSFLYEKLLLMPEASVKLSDEFIKMVIRLLKEKKIFEQWQKLGVSLELANDIIFVDLPNYFDAGKEKSIIEGWLDDPRLLLAAFASVKNISRSFKINMKLATFGKNHPLRLSFILKNQDVRQIVDRIAENLNRETTSHPSERRMEEDEKTSLFNNLAGEFILYIEKAGIIFDEYFRNNPADYMVSIDDLLELLRYVSTADLTQIIRLIKEDPKLSITDIEEKIKNNFSDDENIEFIVRKLRWIISNLFIVESKINVLSSFIKQLKLMDNKKDTEKFRTFLKSINRAKNFTALSTIAQQNRIELASILQFKFNAVMDSNLEEIIASALTNKKLEKKELEAVNEVFLQLPVESKQRIYNKVKIVTESAMKRNKEAENAINFLKEYAFLNEQAEAEQPLTPQSPKQQISHIYYEPLLRLGIEERDDRIFLIFRDLIRAMHDNEQLNKTRSLALSKNKLYQELMLFANQRNPAKTTVFKTILENLYSEEGITAANAHEKYAKLMKYLIFYQKLLETQFSISKTIQSQSEQDLKLFAEVIVRETKMGVIDEEKHEAFLKEYGKIKGNILIRKFEEKLLLSDEEEEKINDFCLNARFAWRDYNNNDIYDLIVIYLSQLNTAEQYELLKEGLIRWIDGEEEFMKWRYASPDYTQLVEMIIENEVKLQNEDIQKAFNATSGATPVERLFLMEQEEVSDLKSQIEQLLQWEKEEEYDIILDGEKYKVRFTGDFLNLFTVGHYPGSTSCQDCTYGDSLNRGLMGYVMNGSNKAVIIYDSKGNIVARRIVKLRIDLADAENIRPVIFVEESTQFGMKSNQVDALYAILDIVSLMTGVRIASSKYRTAFASELQSRGEVQDLTLHLLVGRSHHEYSDAYHRDYRTEPEDVDIQARVKPLPEGEITKLQKQYKFIREETLVDYTQLIADEPQNNNNYDGTLFKKTVSDMKQVLTVEQAI